MNWKIILVCSALLIITASCGQKSFETHTVDIIDGVRHVHNNAPQWGDETKIELDFVQETGSLEATDENYIMWKISDVCRDSDGNIYIINSGDCRIQKFNADGEYMATIGRKGEGPGEFKNSPVNLTFAPNEELYVGVNYDFIVLDKAGKELRRYRQETDIRPSQCWLLPGGRMIIGGKFGMVGLLSDAQRMSFDYENFPLFFICDLEGKVVHSFGKPDVIINPKSSDYYIVADAPVAVDGAGNIYITYRYKNLIEKRDADGNILFAADRKLNYEVTEVNDVMNAPNTVSMGIAVDHKNRIWILTFVSQPENWKTLFDSESSLIEKSYAVFEVFDDESILLGSLPLPEDIFLFRIFDDRLLIVDPDRVSVSEYKIVEK